MLRFDECEVLTFDCYGTLIDWETGIWEALRPVLADHRVDLAPDKALELYGALEAEVERGAYLEYTAVLRRVLEALGSRLGFAPTLTVEQALARTWEWMQRQPAAAR